MQEENTAAGQSEQLATITPNHYYLEVGRELLSKPNLLCDLIESRPVRTIVFCNSPSDTDFVEVMLKKRGVSAHKLIGNVPQPKLDRALEAIRSGESRVIVLTDIAARSVDLGLFELAVNYSVPQDADIYNERSGTSRAGSAIRDVISLVSPLDLANFHYIKKGLGIEPQIAEQPSKEVIMRSRLESMIIAANSEPALSDESVQEMTKLINSNPEKDKLIALLVHNTLNVLPSLRSTSSRSEQEEGFVDDQDDSYDDRGGRGRRQTRGRNNYRDRDSGGRGDSRRGRGGSDYDDYSPRVEDDSEEGDSGRRGSNRRGQRGERTRQPSGPAKKDTRIYLGVGNKDGVNKDFIEKILEGSGIGNDGIKHFSARGNYTFLDIDDEHAQNALDILRGAESPTGKKLGAVKAVTINASMPQDENSQEDASQNLEGEGVGMEEDQGFDDDMSDDSEREPQVLEEM